MLYLFNFRIFALHMNNKRKLKILQNRIAELNKIHPKIDWGGCGTFSYYISDILDKNNIKNEIIYVIEKEPPVNAFRCDIKFTHVLIKTDYGYIDNHSIYKKYLIWNEITKSYYEPEFKVLEKPKLGEMLEEPRLWNDVFDADKRKLLEEDIKKIKI